LNIVAVKAPGFGKHRQEWLEDIAILTGGKVITADAGLQLDQVTLDLLGTARRVIVTKENTTLVAMGNEIAIKARCETIKRQIEVADSVYDQEKLRERLAKLVGGIAVIKVGAATETEMNDRKLRLEDALNASKAAVEEGIVPGGGAALAHLSSQLETWANHRLKDEELIGAMIVVKSLTAPLKCIAENAGQNGAVIAERLKGQDFNVGYNAITHEIVDLFAAGIVDPVKVTKSALQNAASIAGMILTTECVVASPSNS
jgi:chaperonin GroEL